MSKKIGKNITKNLSGKHSQKLLDHAKKLLHVHIKLFQKEQFKKQQIQLVILLIIKSLIKLQRIHWGLIQRLIHKHKKN